MNKTLIYFLLVISLITIISTEACGAKENDDKMNEIKCRKLTVANSDTHLCVLKEGGGGCEEKKICEYESEQCSVKVEGYKCTAGEENSCTPSKITCGEEENGKSAEDYCELLDVEEGKECKYTTGQKCTPTQIICGKEEAGKASPTYCNLLKVENENTQACVINKDNNQCIQASKCDQVTKGATKTICEKLAVNTSDKEKCIVEKDACTIKTICNGAAGTSDNDCKDFYVSDSATKKCVKKSGEDICEEIQKSEDEIKTPVPSTKNQTSSNTTNKDDENGIEGMKISLFIFTLLLIF